MSGLTKENLKNAKEDSQHGEKIFAKQLLERWGVKRGNKHQTLAGVLEAHDTPSNIRLGWFSGSPDIWEIMSKGADIRATTGVLKELEDTLSATRLYYSEAKSKGAKIVTGDMIGVAFKVREMTFIYSGEFFPTLEVTSADEDIRDFQVPANQRRGGVVCFSAGDYTVRRVIFPEHLADYGCIPKNMFDSKRKK